MKKLNGLLIVTMLLSTLTLTGCGGTDVRNQTTTTTTGQELLDLKEALDAGVITADEYAKKRKQILRQD